MRRDVTMIPQPTCDADRSRPLLLSPAAERMKPSISSSAAQRARELARAGRNIINLTTGEPDFETPAEVTQAAILAMRKGQTKYTNVDGTPELKSAIVSKFERDNGLRFSPDQIVVTNGAKQAIFSAMAATLREGDEVIVPAPYWVTYPEVVRCFGAFPKIVACKEENGFKLDPADLDAAIGPRTRWLFLNSPSNPSGAVYSKDELSELAVVLRRHPHVWVLSDDIYEHLLLEDMTFATMAGVDAELQCRTLTVNGVSKAYCMTGWRIGFAAGPTALVSQMSKFQSQSTGNPCSISQAAAIAALEGPRQGIEQRNEAYRARLELVLERLNDIPGMSCSRPRGAFYVFPSCSAAIGKRTPGGTAIASDRDFAAYLLEREGVAVVFGEAYGMSPYFRISIASDADTLSEACDRIARAWSSLS